MRILLQRVKQASVCVENKVVGDISSGLLLLVGITKTDTTETLKKLAQKVVSLRIFEDADGKMNLCALDTQAEILVVSQFTLYADCRKGRRPGFTDAAHPDQAKPMIDDFVVMLQQLDVKKVETGIFGAYMDVSLINDGPITIMLDSVELC